MEHVGAIPEGEWGSLNGMCSEEAEFMAQLLGNCSIPNEVLNDTNFLVSPTFWPTSEPNRNFTVVDESAMYYSSDETNTTSICSLSQGISGYSGGSSILFPFSSQECCYSTLSHHVPVTNNSLMAMDSSRVEGKNDSQVHSAKLMAGDDNFLNQDVNNDSIESNHNIMSEDVIEGKRLDLKGRFVSPIPPLVPRGDKIISPSESKKRSRVPYEVTRNNKNIKFHKCPKFDDSDDDDNSNSNAVFHRQSSSSCCSEDESNASHEMKGTTSCLSSKGSRARNSSGKTRVSRGSATDPQSLYARKRRERINERLKVLQTLVPNGTKVDISTMLEEAVEYVKFLQLQIKLLSSDDHWMYAPIAYNGMDIGLNLKITTPKTQS